MIDDVLLVFSTFNMCDLSCIYLITIENTFWLISCSFHDYQMIPNIKSPGDETRAYSASKDLITAYYSRAMRLKLTVQNTSGGRLQGKIWHFSLDSHSRVATGNKA